MTEYRAGRRFKGSLKGEAKVLSRRRYVLLKTFHSLVLSLTVSRTPVSELCGKLLVFMHDGNT